MIWATFVSNRLYFIIWFFCREPKIVRFWSRKPTESKLAATHHCQPRIQRGPHGIWSPLFWAHGQLQDSDNAWLLRLLHRRLVPEHTENNVHIHQNPNKQRLIICNVHFEKSLWLCVITKKITWVFHTNCELQECFVHRRIHWSLLCHPCRKSTRLLVWYWVRAAEFWAHREFLNASAFAVQNATWPLSLSAPASCEKSFRSPRTLHPAP